MVLKLVTLDHSSRRGNPGWCGRNVAARPVLRFPPTDTAFPHCSMDRPGVSFLSAGCSLIQFGGESAPPWTGDGLWRRRDRQDHRPIGVHTGRRCFSRSAAVTKRYPQPDWGPGTETLYSESLQKRQILHVAHWKDFYRLNFICNLIHLTII